MSLNLAGVGQWQEGSRTWTSTDAILYALGVGAGADDPAAETAFTTENSIGVTQLVLPTFGVLLESREARPDLGAFARSKILHAEQSISLAAPLSAAGTATSRTAILGFDDKGRDAIARLETQVSDAATGTQLATLRRSIFIRGEGGFGGDRGPASSWTAPTAAPDSTLHFTTRPDLALLYRLSGDRNPLHSDPAFARTAGFQRPILHGLCTYGIVGRLLLAHLCDRDPTLFSGLSARFSAPTIPGETISLDIWQRDGGAIFTARVGDRVVLERGVFESR